MSSETSTPTQDAADDPVWGQPQPRRTWSTRQTLAAVGIAVVIAALGGAAIYGATSGGSNAMGPGMNGPGPGRWGGPGMGPGGPDGPGAAVHGEFVVANGNGGYRTELTQTGVVTAVSAASITAKSADGFTQTYALDGRAANAQPAVNDTVTIRATLDDGTATATVVEGNDGPGGPR
jgi:hypothetical protein